MYQLIGRACKPLCNKFYGPYICLSDCVGWGNLLLVCMMVRWTDTWNIIYVYVCWKLFQSNWIHYHDVLMSVMASQITSLTIVYSTVYSRHRSKKTSKLRLTGLCAGNSPVTSEFPAQGASNAENVSIWLRHHVLLMLFPSVNFFMSKR